MDREPRNSPAPEPYREVETTSLERLPRSKGARYPAAVSGFGQTFPHIRAHLEALETDLDDLVDSRVRLIPIISHHLLGGGGKRVRPTLFFLSADAAGYRGPHLVRIGSILELIHTATLLHDDVVDGAPVRRGRPVANDLYGNAASVLVGDYVYSLASVLLARTGHRRILQLIAEATNGMAEGEIHQLMGSRNPEVTEDEYLTIVEKKTALLFGASTVAGAVAARAPKAVERALAAYGSDLGVAFQLADDVLDYLADESRFGKTTGTDFLEGKFTLPVIAAMREASPAVRERLAKAVSRPRKDGRSFARTRDRIGELGGFDYTRRMALEYAARARTHLEVLPKGRPRRSLERMATLAADRAI